MMVLMEEDCIVIGTIINDCRYRRWHHDLCYNEETDKYISLIVPTNNEKYLESIEANSPVESIVQAYIQALKSR